MQLKTNQINLYEIDNEYVEYLYNNDDRVYYHESYKQAVKPYVGILLSSYDIDYFIPLTSAKQKHINQKVNSRDYIMIVEIVDADVFESRAIYKEIPNNNKRKYHILSVLDIRKMIPVPKGRYDKIHISSLDINYQFLFYKEYEYIKSHQDLILKNAMKIYEKTKQLGHRLSKFHCDYNVLERVMFEFENKL